jgi:cytochrome c5
MAMSRASAAALLAGALLSGAVMAGALTSCGEAARPAAIHAKTSIAETLRGELTRREADGKVLYERYCLICHGATAAGDGFNATTLTPRPADLLKQLQSEGEEHVAETIRIGSKARGHSPLCPPWGGSLDVSRIEEIVLYLKKIRRPEEGAKPK